MIKVIVIFHETKIDSSCNRYFTTKIINCKNHLSVVVDGKVSLSVLERALGLQWYEVYDINVSTGSAKLSSLPKTTNKKRVSVSTYDINWKNELENIGFKCKPLICHITKVSSCGFISYCISDFDTSFVRSKRFVSRRLALKEAKKDFSHYVSTGNRIRKF